MDRLKKLFETDPIFIELDKITKKLHGSIELDWAKTISHYEKKNLGESGGVLCVNID